MADILLTTAMADVETIVAMVSYSQGSQKRSSYRLGAALLALIVLVLLILDSKNNRYRLMSLVGLLANLFILWIFSKHRSRVSKA